MFPWGVHVFVASVVKGGGGGGGGVREHHRGTERRGQKVAGTGKKFEKKNSQLCVIFYNKNSTNWRESLIRSGKGTKCLYSPVPPHPF